MIDITPDVILVPVHREGVYQLWEDVQFKIGNRYHFTIPMGFETDGASIPRFAWITTGTPFEPEHIRAAVLHDYLYQHNRVTRLEADQIFCLILRFDGVSAYQAGKMYMALRAFGWIAWRRYRRKEELLRKAVVAVEELSKHAKLDSTQSDKFTDYVVDESREATRKRQGEKQ